MGEPQFFRLRAGSSLPFFWISGFGRARVGQIVLRMGQAWYPTHHYWNNGLLVIESYIETLKVSSKRVTPFRVVNQGIIYEVRTFFVIIYGWRMVLTSERGSFPPTTFLHPSMTYLPYQTIKSSEWSKDIWWNSKTRKKAKAVFLFCRHHIAIRQSW